METFDPTSRKKLNSEGRRRLLTPNATLVKLGYKKGDSFADIGCGIGLFTFQAAEIGGESSKIYAIDTSELMLSEVKKRIKDTGYKNIVPLQSGKYDFKLPDGSVDFVLICTVLHEIDDKPRFIREASRICRSGGKISVIEFGEKQTEYGLPLEHRIPRDITNGLLSDAGFRDIVTADLNTTFYAVTAAK